MPLSLMYRNLLIVRHRPKHIFYIRLFKRQPKFCRNPCATLYQLGLYNLKTIAHAPHRFQIDRARWVRFDAFAQPADVDIKGAGIVDVRGFPDLFHELAAFYDFAMMVDEQLQQRALLRRHRILAIGRDNGARGQVEVNRPTVELVFGAPGM